MMPLTVADRRLLVEIACAGVNHGMQDQVRAMLPALPYLVPDPSLQAACLVILLIGLNDIPSARKQVAQVRGLEAETLKEILAVLEPE